MGWVTCTVTNNYPFCGEGVTTKGVFLSHRCSSLGTLILTACLQRRWTKTYRRPFLLGSVGGTGTSGC